MVGEIDHKIRIDGFESDHAGKAKLLQLVKTLRRECENKSLHKACQFLWGHQQVVYQLITSHESLAKLFVVSSSIAICEWGVPTTKSYQEPLVSFIEVEHFGCFEANIIMWDRG